MFKRTLRVTALSLAALLFAGTAVEARQRGRGRGGAAPPKGGGGLSRTFNNAARGGQRRGLPPKGGLTPIFNGAAGKPSGKPPGKNGSSTPTLGRPGPRFNPGGGGPRPRPNNRGPRPGG